MKTKRYIPESMDRTFICLGKEGEGNHLALHFDTAYWREEYPEAEILLWVAPPRGEGYMAALEERSGDVIWTVTAADTATEGQGLIELILRDAGSGTTIKSATARTLIRCSPSSKEPAEPPQAHRPWWERVLSMIRGLVKTVNGVGPDENGNVVIEAGGAGTVTSVNGVTPDKNGNITLNTCSCETATDEEMLDILMEMDALPVITDESGAIMTDENGAVLLI